MFSSPMDVTSMYIYLFPDSQPPLHQPEFSSFSLETVLKLRGIQSRGNPAEKDSDWNQS